jgi:LysR family nod box-dependent transcriptional activator
LHFRQLDLNLLVALDALLTERNITEAGRRLHVTQSAMSGSLARLREYFGDELLVQIGRKMVPSPLAESLAEPVREILLKVKAAVDTKPGFDPATSTRRFSLMMSDYLSTVLMTEALQRIARVAPLVSFEVVSNDIISPGDALDRGDVDLLIMPRDHLAKEHPDEILFTDGYVCVVAADNSTVGKTLSQQEYLSLGHVCVQLGRGRAPVMDEWFLSRLGVKRRIEIITMNFNSVPQYVVGTNRIGTMHQRLAEYYCRYLPLRIVPCPFELPPIVEAVQWHRYFDQDPGLAWLRGVLKEAARALAPSDRLS